MGSALFLKKNKTTHLKEDLGGQRDGTGSRGRFVDLAAASLPPPKPILFPFYFSSLVFLIRVIKRHAKNAGYE